MSALGICALFSSVTFIQKSSTTAVLFGRIEKPSKQMKKLYRSPSFMINPSDVLNKYVLGIHEKTKRTLSEEAESGNEVSVHSWLREGFDPNEIDIYGYTPLINASALGRLGAIKQLLKSGADVNQSGPYGFTALHAASQVI